LKILYLGLDLDNFHQKENAYHYPIIKIVPKPKGYINKSLKDLSAFTHFIFTSPRSVNIFCDHLLSSNKLHFLKDKSIISIGEVTQKALAKYQITSAIPKAPTQEGIIELLKNMHLENSYFLIPRSSIARKEIDYFLSSKRINYLPLDIYDTHANQDLKKINLKDFEEVFFTSPSTVRAFVKKFKNIPSHLGFKSIGPITKKTIEKHLL